jgi:hypothetical protein
MSQRKPTTVEIDKRLRMLISSFGDYLVEFDRNPAFTNEQLRHHLNTCRLRDAEHRTATAAVTDEQFLKSLWDTLRSWRMQVRGARLVEWPKFRDAFGRCNEEIKALEGLSLAAVDRSVRDVADATWKLIDKLAISDNASKLVAGTKALHHLIPKLIVPIDRTFTGAFFGWNNYDWQHAQPKALRSAFEAFSRITREITPASYVGERWRSSATKVVDNAVVAFCRKHLLDERSYIRALEARARELGILDEIEAEAKRRAGEHR